MQKGCLEVKPPSALQQYTLIPDSCRLWALPVTWEEAAGSWVIPVAAGPAAWHTGAGAEGLILHGAWLGLLMGLPASVHGAGSIPV